jgi:hypothetical protein
MGDRKHLENLHSAQKVQRYGMVTNQRNQSEVKHFYLIFFTYGYRLRRVHRGYGEEPVVKNKSEVIKHSAAIHMQNNITLLQRRAWNALLANAYDDLLTKDKHAMKVKDLMWTLEFESHNEEYLKEALRALISCKVEWHCQLKAN